MVVHMLAIVAPETHGHVVGDIQTEAIDAVARVSITIRIQPTFGHLKDMLFDRRMQVALERMAVTLARDVDFLEFGEGFDA